MKMSDFNLSSFIAEIEAGPLGYEPQSILYKDDVKEFIRLLKGKLKQWQTKDEAIIGIEAIDKLAGEELTKPIEDEE